MEFIENNKPIYLQIADKICDDILSHRYTDGDRIPSVRETAAIVEVNANTVMRSYDYLQQAGIIFNKRGIGFFVSEGATGIIKADRKVQFLDTELNAIFSRLNLLDVTPGQLAEMYKKYLELIQKS